MMRSGKPAAWAAAALARARARWRRPRRRRISSRRCSAASRRPRQQPYISMPFSDDDGQVYAPRGEGRVATWQAAARPFACATCDGRYFPVTGSDNASRAAQLQQLLPGQRNQGGLRQQHRQRRPTDNGKSYSDLPNAFRYRNELVAGCTCNGKDQIGLAPVKIENDPTLRKGDIVAGENGLLVAGRSADRRGAELNFSPASDKVRARYRAACRWWREE